MRLVVQRVKEAKVTVEGKVVGAIGHGILTFLGIHKNDRLEDTTWLVNKLIQLRMFEDEHGKMNCSVGDVEGEILVVSQFTLYASCEKGRRPGFGDTAKGEVAEAIYEKFVQEVKEQMGSVQSGTFGAMMDVSLINDGPVTFIIDGKS